MDENKRASLIPRSGIILIENGKVALIKRERAGLVYYTFPGGKQEADETPEAAAVREAMEELGIVVRLGQLVAVVDTPIRKQYYFTTTQVSGEFGSGTGDEFNPDIDPHKGRYQPVWVDLTLLREIDVKPRSLAAVLGKGSFSEIGLPLNLED